MTVERHHTASSPQQLLLAHALWVSVAFVARVLHEIYEYGWRGQIVEWMRLSNAFGHGGYQWRRRIRAWRNSAKRAGPVQRLKIRECCAHLFCVISYVSVYIAENG